MLTTPLIEPGVLAVPARVEVQQRRPGGAERGAGRQTLQGAGGEQHANRVGHREQHAGAEQPDQGER